MGNKYYTPSIEEFHVGFRCEIFNGFSWEPYIISTSECLSDLTGEGYRVKYLDKEDIESLGWLDGELRGMTPFIYNELDPDNEFQLYYQYDNHFAQIYDYNSDYVFRGIIKNKSELIKLMKQLNII